MKPRTPEVVASSEFVGALPPAHASLTPALLAVPRDAVPLAVPADEQLRLVRVEAKSAGNLKGLRQMVAAWEAVAEKCNLAFEEMARLAVFRLEVERDRGAELAQTVRRGGDRSRSPKGTLLRVGGLPEGVSRKQSMVYQRLAGIAEPIFRQYVDTCRARHAIPSSRGTLLHARQASGDKPRRRTARDTGADLELPEDVVEAVGRSMHVDVLVGDAKIKAAVRLQPNAQDIFERLQGSVFVTCCTDPVIWIPRLQELHERARVERVAMALPAEVWSAWFDKLVSGEWTICFLQNQRTRAGGNILCHFGQKPAAFRLALRGLGPVIG